MTMLKARFDKKDVVRSYSRKAWFYDLWGALTETRARRRAMALAAIQDGEAVLEVAVGTGLAFEEIVRANPHGENAGIDLTPAMLDLARRKLVRQGLSNYTLAEGDAYALDFPDDHFDLVLNNYMFDLLPEEDFPTVLAEFRRVLKPGGRLVLVSMTKGERFYQHFYEWLYRIDPGWLAGCRGVLLQDVLAAAGFRDIQREMVSQLGFPSEVLRAEA